jgi:hypothetical protein
VVLTESMGISVSGFNAMGIRPTKIAATPERRTNIITMVTG